MNYRQFESKLVEIIRDGHQPVDLRLSAATELHNLEWGLNPHEIIFWLEVRQSRAFTESDIEKHATVSVLINILEG
ncbi:hypothetical protein [Ktedonobacter robiniae]|uniref:Uncharacterized protein n=1 Tax=Ktedonobacter robiniae TaxID=2778365 RepID=A0ABQ3URV8_9CHLR|nr:hypothetical protein [Ktedonobacter robiniae]GHO55506.1 hypothetical protein KSB_39810 [Ktedonobacter robiniae]